MNTALAFQSTTFDVVDHNNQPWIQSSQLATALGYADESSVSRIYDRNKDEFSNDMTETVKLTASGNLETKVRIFSLRGCHLIAMFARTKVAKAFRVWALDVLEKLGSNVSAPTPEPIPLTKSTVSDRQPLKDLVDAWVGTSPISYSAAWKQVNAHFSITKITFLPKEWIPDAIAFVQARIDKAQAQPKALPESPKLALPAGTDPTLKAMAADYYNAVVDLQSEIPRRVAEVEEKGRKLADEIKVRVLTMLGTDNSPTAVIAQHKFIDGLNAGPRIAHQTMHASLDAMRDHAMLLDGLSVLGR